MISLGILSSDLNKILEFCIEINLITAADCILDLNM